ncbi:outer membrane lipoprotein-sorting protein [bacterium]|nr:outer membrane lipoprotein-sorting protein [bacterium]
MIRITGVCVGLLIAWSVGVAQTQLPATIVQPSGEQLLELIDANMVAATQQSTFSLNIQTRRGSRTIRARSWAEGSENSFTEFLDPPRERGVKMLKLGTQLWTYHPGTDRVIRIAGHLLRQSVMGSDLSYEDLLDNQELLQYYEAAVTGIDTVLERSCWVLDLVTREGEETAYHTRRIWVDRERLLPLREERFGSSGRLLKQTGITEVMQLTDRWYPRRMYFRDMLKEGAGMEILFETIEFDCEIPSHLFTTGALRR